MSNSVPKELALVKGLYNECKYEEALQHIKDIEQKENLNPEDTLRILSYKGRIYSNLGHQEKVLKIIEDLYQKSQEMKMPLFTLDALSLEASIFHALGKFEDYFKTVEQYEKLFESIPREHSLEFQEREAYLIWHKGLRNFYTGKLNIALDLFYKSLTLFKQLGPQGSSLQRAGVLSIIVYAYTAKGELKLALECAEKALSLIPKSKYMGPIMTKAQIYRIMGFIYHQKGDLNRALEYQTNSLEIFKKYEERWWMAWTYYHIISIFLTKKQNDEVQRYLHEFKLFNERHESNAAINGLYQLTTALILKSSSRMRDRVEAEHRLKNFIEISKNPFSTNTALINLCNWYFEEFQLSNQMEILDDIFPLIDHLVKNARDQNSYSLLANVKLFQAKLALLQINLVEARKLFSEAQKIADENDLQLLANSISREHDKLLEELKLWESIKKTQASVTERLKLASIDGVIDRLQGRGVIEVPEVSVEEPILLLIMDKSGVSYFTHSFIGDWDFDDLFSSFMSAFNAFSSEIFSNSIDRVKIADNTILINPIESFLACYIIKGQSYPAQQKLARFTEAIRENSEIWQALNKSVNTSEMLELDKPPALKTVINEIF
ncbi:MAG: hypothetical protein ACFE94_05770 [Candidatus Hodarchaeota archaeon]